MQTTEPRKKDRQGRRYSDEFKREAVHLLTSAPETGQKSAPNSVSPDQP